MNFRFAIRALLVAATVAGAQHAHALAALDFQDMTCAKTQALCGAAQTYSAKGFTLQYAPAAGEQYPVGLTAVGKSWQYNVNGSIALTANSCSATTTLTNNKGAAFAMFAIDLAEMNGDSPSSVTFVGTKVDGSKVTKSVQLDGKAGWQRVVMPSAFSSLKSVTWTQGDCSTNKPHMFDNIVVN
ncbi:MAG: hypothetical protein EPO09_12200 [Aquabacterium sp.]|uniref:hypothetical protein n=1 Tax=Aquabacterium sp. TaxID=1872578 RepID=UPI001211FA1B|nr:hypothetical protein [Aquabacterium sp.]TAK93578.1 MAG: hypothetical protein EPO09_12200 [Aquabacterium sp.]